VLLKDFTQHDTQTKKQLSYKEQTHLISTISTHKVNYLKQFKELFSSIRTKTYEYISQQILQDMQYKQTYYLSDEVDTPYYQEKHTTSVHKQRLDTVSLC
jgi:hypothetical protein